MIFHRRRSAQSMPVLLNTASAQPPNITSSFSDIHVKSERRSTGKYLGIAPTSGSIWSKSLNSAFKIPSRLKNYAGQGNRSRLPVPE